MIATQPSVSKPSKPFAFTAVLLTAMLSLAGCSLLPEREPISLYEPTLAGPVAHPVDHELGYHAVRLRGL